MADSTLIVIATSGQEYPLPGTHWTPEMAVTSLSAVVPGIASMQSEVTDNNGQRIITFRNRSGSKA